MPGGEYRSINRSVRASSRARRPLAGLRVAVIGLVLGGLATSCAPLPVPPTLRSLVAAAPAERGRPVLEPGGLRFPTTVDPDRPLPVLLALHGAGGTGPRIAERLAACADRNGWLLVAPTLAYRDFMDVDQLRRDDEEDLPRIRALLADVRARLPAGQVSDETYVYGFSRGGQLAHRLALFYPDEIDGVAVLAAGTYTLPSTGAQIDGQPRSLPFPYGLSDLSRYAGHPFDPQALVGKPFWIGVGEADVAADQVPRGWDPLLGPSRLERASRFAEILRSLGADVSLNVFPHTGHDETAVMRERACDFLTSLTPTRAR
jgi:predicted esterase